MTSFQLVPFDLAPQAQNVLAALLRCQEAFDAAMSEHKRVTVNADEFKRQLDDAETAIGDLKIENHSLRNALARASNAASENESLKNQISQLKREQADQERRVQQLLEEGAADQTAVAQHAHVMELRRSVVQLQQEHASVVAELQRKHESELLALHSANQATVQMFQQQLALVSKQQSAKK